MQFVSFPILNVGGPPTKVTFKIPIVSRTVIEERIISFIHSRVHRKYQGEENSVVCQSLFYPSASQLFFLQNSFSILSKGIDLGGKLFFCPLCEGNKAFVLCFFPRYKNRSLPDSPGDIQPLAKVLPDLHNAAVFTFSHSNVTCLMCENGSISPLKNGIFTFKNFELKILLCGERSVSLHCKKMETALPFPTSPIRERASSPASGVNFVKVLCLCKVQGFSFFLKIPVLTELELEEILSEAYHIRATKFNLPHECKHNSISKQNLFLTQTHSMICFPRGMGLQLPFGAIRGGCVYFSSQNEEGKTIFQCTVIADLFKNLQKNARIELMSFPFWQTGINNLSKRNLYTSKIFTFTCQNIALVQKCASSEFMLAGSNVKLISTVTGTGRWGLFFSKSQDSVLHTSTSSPAPQPGPSNDPMSLSIQPLLSQPSTSSPAPQPSSSHGFINLSIKPLALQSSMSMLPFDRGEKPGANRSPFIEPSEKRARREEPKEPSQSAMEKVRKEDEARKASCAEALMLLCHQEQPE